MPNLHVYVSSCFLLAVEIACYIVVCQPVRIHSFSLSVIKQNLCDAFVYSAKAMLITRDDIRFCIFRDCN
jgi:hypothetical protein